MPHSRAERVGDLIREELSELFLRAVKDPRVGMVTITGVTVTADLRSARVYVVSRAGGGAEDQTLAGLRAARGFLGGGVWRAPAAGPGLRRQAGRGGRGGPDARRSPGGQGLPEGGARPPPSPEGHPGAHLRRGPLSRPR